MPETTIEEYPDLESAAIDDLRFADYNPRSMSQMELQKLARSIEEFGFVEPVVVNKRAKDRGFPNEGNTIVGGHQRVRAAILLGWKFVPAVFIEVSPQQEKALNLALNRISGDWDGPMLGELLAELKADPDIDEFLTGFDASEIDRMIEATQIDIPDEFPSVGEGGSGHVDTDYRCPSCGYEWTGQPKPGGKVDDE